MPNLSVAIVSVPVRDQTRARDFYRDKLGFTLVMESAMGDDMTWVSCGRQVAARQSRS